MIEAFLCGPRISLQYVVIRRQEGTGQCERAWGRIKTDEACTPLLTVGGSIPRRNARYPHLQQAGCTSLRCQANESLRTLGSCSLARKCPPDLASIYCVLMFRGSWQLGVDIWLFVHDLFGICASLFFFRAPFVPFQETLNLKTLVLFGGQLLIELSGAETHYLLPIVTARVMGTTKARGVLQLLPHARLLWFPCSLVCSPIHSPHCFWGPSPRTQM